MASIKKTTDAAGNVVFKVRVSGGRGRRVTRTWRPQDGWSARTTERELRKFAASLENEMNAGEIVTRSEKMEQKKMAALEAAKMKTLRQFTDGVFMPAKEVSFSENARSNYRTNLDKHILPALGDYQMMDITPPMLAKFFVDMQRSTYITKKTVRQKGKPDKVEENTHNYSYSAIIKIYIILHGIFKMAYMTDSIPSNPMDKVPRPKPRKDEATQEPTEKAYTVPEMQHILSCLENEPLK